jgi:light-regulated signal transduction histidine kinase (bacteriophytochrome)
MNLNLTPFDFKVSSLTNKSIIQVGMHKTEEGNEYFVKDNGVDFDTKYENKLFKPFNRLHHADDFPGTGIGLATIKRIISRHNGNMRAASELNKGTTIYFTLGKANIIAPASAS